MLQIKEIEKQYKTGELIQQALNKVSLSFRDNEFVSILGPSGSGKTTLLNIVGGLDSYDHGDLIINGRSTKNYRDGDWDTYRNHTIGFVFQSYNLIPHQTVLSNVELALTISGVSKSVRKQRAKEALEKVGLGDHIHKRPSQMSGGQMQRVAIARALVNDPDILLADEPTGALDTHTSVQIMELLQEVAKDRLVIMVTHNPELAQEYSTRIIRLRDGIIEGDTNPFTPSAIKAKEENIKRAKMSLKTSFALSFNNLKTKKSRTLLTSFAGSIGIIGIALILSLSNGVNTYITDLQKDTMASYPVTIQEESIDMKSMMQATMNVGDEKEVEGIHPNYDQLEAMTSMTVTNNLTDFKSFLDDKDSDIDEFLGENGITYSYNVNFSIFSKNSDNQFINSDADTDALVDSNSPFGAHEPYNPMASMISGGTTAIGASNFTELPKHSEETVSTLMTDGYDIVAGQWPQAYDEVVLFLNNDHSIHIDAMYQLGLMSEDQYVEIVNQVQNKEAVTDLVLDYEDVLNHTFYMLPASQRYVDQGDGTFKYLSDEDLQKAQTTITDSTKLKIVGIMKSNDETNTLKSTTPIGYTTLLTDYVVEKLNESSVVNAQLENEKMNILTGYEFEIKDDAQKVIDIKAYLSNLEVSEKASFYSVIMMSSGMPMSQTSDEMMASMLDRWLASNPEDEILLGIYDETLGGSSYEENLKDFGYVNYDAPAVINIYTDTFENKELLSQAISDYNDDASEENQIVYTDYVELMTSSMTSMIDVISYVLIAFVGVSLIVSCIMIGIITHISVLERTKEIGVLRALGASKKNISQVFNAETVIIGLCSGTLGIIITILLNIPITSMVQELLGDDSLVVGLPMAAGFILIAISSIITVIGGLLPAKKAATKDPVIALRSE